MSKDHIVWNSSYNLGVEDIDNQHKFFANLINRLSDELRDRVSQYHTNSIINELDAYARFHFISEENIMYRAGYPKFDEHRSSHLNLIDKLGSKEGLLSLEPTKQRVDEIIEFLIDWFLDHTINEDKIFANYLDEKSSAGSE